MKLFQKRDTIIQNIAFMAIMSAINIVLILISTFLPYLLLLLSVVLPFISLLVTIFCKKRYYPIYIVVTLGLSFLVSFNAISNILFYLLPGLLSGFVFGFCLEKEIPSSYSILYSSFVYVVCSYLCLIICNAFLDQSIENLYFELLNLNTFIWRSYIIAPFIFAISIIQSSISYLIIQNEIRKIGIEEKEIDENFETIFLFVFILLSIISILLKPEIYLMFIGFASYEFIHVLKTAFLKSAKFFAINISVFGFSTIFAFAIGYNLIEAQNFMMLILIPYFIVGIIVLCNNCLTKHNK